MWYGCAILLLLFRFSVGHPGIEHRGRCMYRPYIPHYPPSLSPRPAVPAVCVCVFLKACLLFAFCFLLSLSEQNFACSIKEFIFPPAGIPEPEHEQKEEKTSKRSQSVAMFQCFSSPAVCARAIHERGVRNMDTVLWQTKLLNTLSTPNFG